MSADSAATLVQTRSGVYGDALDFRLPPFMRLAWATPAARKRWLSPMGRLAHQVRTAEWQSVAAGVRAAAIIAAPRAHIPALAGEWSRSGLRSLNLGPGDAMRIHLLNGKTRSPGPADEVHLLARSDRLEELAAVWRAGDLVRIAGWLGYPSCCAALLKTAAIEQGCIDTTWAMVRGRSVHENGLWHADILDATVNPLLSPLGLRAVPHRPCSFHCEASRKLAGVYAKIRSGTAPREEDDRLESILGWPMAWSSLHGIIEITLPIFKLCHEGDATAATYRIRLTGGPMPEAAANGLAFPHQPIAQPPQIDDETER